MDRCTTCGKTTGTPWRVWYDGEIAHGCIDVFHSGSLTGQDDAWHNRPSAKAHRTKVAKRMREMMRA